MRGTESVFDVYGMPFKNEPGIAESGSENRRDFYRARGSQSPMELSAVSGQNVGPVDRRFMP